MVFLNVAKVDSSLEIDEPFLKKVTAEAQFYYQTKDAFSQFSDESSQDGEVTVPKEQVAELVGRSTSA